MFAEVDKPGIPTNATPQKESSDMRRLNPDNSEPEVPTPDYADTEKNAEEQEKEKLQEKEKPVISAPQEESSDMRTLNPEDSEPELLIPDYVDTEENAEDDQKEKSEKAGEAVISAIQVAPLAEPINVTEQEMPEKQIEHDEEESQSDFRLQSHTDNFLEPEIEPDIPSLVSEFTTTTTVYSESEQKPKAASQTADRDSEQKSSLRRDTDASRKISGDFTVGTFVRFPSKIIVKEDTSVEEAELEESQPEQAEVEVFDRELYYQMHTTLTSELSAIKIKNNFLNRKLVEYYRKRKMEHVFKETDQQIDTQQKYWKRLDTFQDLLTLDQRRRLTINAELDDLRCERDKRLQLVHKIMKELIEREKYIGTGLIHTKTGKEIPEKMLERLLKRQWFTAEQLARYRLKHIKIRNKVTEKQNAMQTADKLGPTLRLVDYEELKVENRGFADKVEERDEELTKLQLKNDDIFGILAHLREKSASMTIDIVTEQDILRSVDIEFLEARERTNYFKMERDRYRSIANKVRDDSGILLYSTLLTDMENTIEETNTTKKLLIDVKERQKTQLSKLRAIRKNIEIAQNLKVSGNGKIRQFRSSLK